MMKFLLSIATLVFLFAPSFGLRLECGDAGGSFAAENILSCVIPEVDLTDENVDLNITEVTIDENSYYDVKFEHSTVPKLPVTIFEQILKLRSLRATNSSVQELQDGLFASAKYLRKLYLNDNLLKELEDSSFQGARDLGLLELSFNQISVISRGAFEELKYLSHANLSHNLIDFVDVDLFRNNELLHTLDLSHNQLKSLEVQLCQVTSLYASHNMIQNFWMDLVEVQQNRQYYSKFMVKIFVDHNEISTFKVDKRFKIRHLALDHNQINEIGNLEEQIPEQIEILDMSYNQLGPIKQEVFRNFYNLRSLYLAHSHLQLQDEYAFIYLVNVTELDISYNNLQELDTKIFSNLNSIELLKVDGNNLTKFEVENLPQKVFAISLFDNAWDCTYLEELFDKLRMLGKVSVPPTSIATSHDPGHHEINGVACENVPVEEQDETQEVVEVPATTVGPEWVKV